MLRYCDVLALGALPLTLCGFAFPAAAADVPAYVAAAVQSPARPPQQMARDADRKPADVIAFTGIKPGDKVADFMPGDGYFTHILSKVVGPQGKLYPFIPQRGFRNVESLRADEQKQREAGKNPPVNSVDAVLPMQHTSDYRNVLVVYETLTGFGGNFGVPEQLDAVFTAEGYHELHNKVDGPVNNAPVDMAAVNKAIFRAIKPGGVYVVADFAAPKGAGFNQTQTLNRAEADAVKQEILAAGFAFDGESGILASPSDDLAKPAAGDKAAQFLLRFRKPATASAETKRYPANIMANYFGNTFVLGTPEDRGRTIFYHADGTYQEFGINDMQMAHWYFDADGHNCMYHEAPVNQEGFVVCHPFEPAHISAKVGDVWIEHGGGGPDGTQVSLVKGYVYPNRRPQPPQQGRQPAPAQAPRPGPQ